MAKVIETMAKYHCPRCGGTRFSATAHIAQEWEIDENGEFTRVITDYMDTAHAPNDDDLWKCLLCGHIGTGSVFHNTEKGN